MLELHIGSVEFFNEENNTFELSEGITLKMEHSLVSVSEWESKYHKPFLDKAEKTKEELHYYLKCMTLNKKNVEDWTYDYILNTKEYIDKVLSYMEDTMTATWFNDRGPKRGGNGEAITSELIYYWMIELNVPVEFQHWHISRLLTLIKVCNIKQQKDQKMPRNSQLRSQAALNSARRKALHTKG